MSMNRLLSVIGFTLIALVAPTSAMAAWPVQPLHGNHVLRGSFLDARDTDYHHGIDIPVDDTHPEAGHPSWASHRVYAVKGGVVSYQDRPPVVPPSSCSGNRTAVGNEIYYHTVPIVSVGQHVEAGQQIGWTCMNRWHLHLTEGFGSNTMNPLLPSNPIVGPYVNPLKPVVNEIAVYTPCTGVYTKYKNRNLIRACGRKLDPTNLSGTVDVRFDAEEPQPMTGLFAIIPLFYSPNHPYAADLAVDRISGPEPGRVLYPVVRRNIFTGARLRSQAPLTVRWAPGFSRWQSFGECKRGHRYATCKGHYWHRAFARSDSQGWQRYWDTTGVVDGHYRITISLTTLTGKKALRRYNMTVNNAHKPLVRNRRAQSQLSAANLDAHVPFYVPQTEDYAHESADEIEGYKEAAMNQGG